MNLLLKELQNGAITYLIGTIAQYGHTLSQMISKVVSSSKGKCFTIVPSRMPEHHLYKFGTGGLYLEDRKGRTVVPVRNDTTHVIESLIEAFFAISETNCGIAEDMISRPSDAGLQKLQQPYLLYQEEVYFFNSNQDSAQQVVRTLRQNDASYYSFFALLSLEKQQQAKLSQPRYYLKIEDLWALASSVQSIIQPAYDSESYLFWDRSGTLLELASSILNSEELPK